MSAWPFVVVVVILYIIYRFEKKYPAITKDRNIQHLKLLDV